MDDLRFSSWKSAAAGFLHEGEFSRASVSSCTGVSKTGSSWVDSVEKQTRRGACIDRVHEDDDHAPSTGGLKKFASPLPIEKNLIQPSNDSKYMSNFFRENSKFFLIYACYLIS